MVLASFGSWEERSLPRYDIGISGYHEMNNIVAFGKALSEPTRVRILNALMQTELCVCELADALEISQSSLSTHLQTLRSIGIVLTEKRQSWIIYSIEDLSLEAIKCAFQHFPPTLPRIGRDNERLANRIRLRIDGCCVVGFGALQKEDYASKN